MINLKTSFAAALVTVGALCAGSAQAANVQWSVGINLPPVATLITSGPMYAPAPVYYPPQPVYYEPSRVVVRPAPVVMYRPAPYYAPRFHGPEVVHTGWDRRGRGWDRDNRHNHFDHGRHDQRGDDHRARHH